MSTDKSLVRCDGCDEYVERTFLCDACCNEPELVEALVPKIMWDGEGDDMELVEEDRYYTICQDCCQGH